MVSADKPPLEEGLVVVLIGLPRRVHQMKGQLHAYPMGEVQGEECCVLALLLSLRGTTVVSESPLPSLHCVGAPRQSCGLAARLCG